MDIKVFLIGSALLTSAWLAGLVLLLWTFWPLG